MPGQRNAEKSNGPIWLAGHTCQGTMKLVGSCAILQWDLLTGKSAPRPRYCHCLSVAGYSVGMSLKYLRVTTQMVPLPYTQSESSTRQLWPEDQIIPKRKTTCFKICREHIAQLCRCFPGNPTEWMEISEFSREWITTALIVTQIDLANFYNSSSLIQTVLQVVTCR